MMLSASWRGKLVRRLSSSDVFDGSAWRIGGDAVVAPQSGHGCRPPCDCGQFSSPWEGMTRHVDGWLFGVEISIHLVARRSSS